MISRDLSPARFSDVFFIRCFNSYGVSTATVLQQHEGVDIGGVDMREVDRGKFDMENLIRKKLIWKNFDIEGFDMEGLIWWLI